MNTNQSVGLNPHLAEQSQSAYNPSKFLLPVSVARASANAQPQYSFKLDQLPRGSSTSVHKDLIPPGRESQSSQVVSAPEQKQANSKPREVQEFFVFIFQFLVQKLASQLPELVTAGVFTLVILGMLLSPLTGGIRVNVHLEVSPSSIQVEKAQPAK